MIIKLLVRIIGYTLYPIFETIKSSKILTTKMCGVENNEFVDSNYSSIANKRVKNLV